VRSIEIIWAAKSNLRGDIMLMTTRKPMKTAVECDSLQVDGFTSEFRARVDIADDFFDLNRLILTVAEDYYTRFRRRNFVSDTVSAADYLSDKSPKNADVLCQEMPIPHHLLSSVKLSIPSSAAWTTHAVGHIHAGRANCVTPLHFDWDLTWVANVCLTGRKRFFIFPPSAGWLLSPVLNLSALYVPKFSEMDRRDLLSKLGGVEVVLDAGEGVLFPSLSWHGVLYEEPSLSLSVRFEQTPGGRPFAALPRSWLLQRLVWRFFREGYRSPAFDFLLEFMGAFFDEKSGWIERYRRISTLCRLALVDMGEAQGAAVLAGENFSTELAVAREALRRCYTVLPNEGDAEDHDGIRDAREYIFQRICIPPDAERLARYALRQRQGLRPRRGLVEIVN
jgi:hypothetical protein